MTTWTVLSLLNWTTEYFTKQNLPSPRLDAEVLLGFALQIERIQLYMQFDRPVTPDELAKFKLLIQRRAKGEPVSYIRNKKEFWSIPLKVGPGVLVPRPDTEVLIEKVKRLLGSQTASLRILDIGTGSGNIPIALAKEFTAAQITAIDFSPEALSYAKENISSCGVADRVELRQMDFLLEADRLPKNEYDLIVSNPPYIAAAEIDALDRGIRDFEPRSALDGGADGLDFYRKIVQCGDRLKETGILAVEIGETQGEAVTHLFKEAGFTEIEMTRDYANLPRVVSGKK